MKAELLYGSPVHDTALKHERRRHRLLAGARAPSLDRQLAAGRPPSSSQALADRAREIVTPTARRELAQRWTRVLDRASQPVPRFVGAPLQRNAVIAAGQDLHEMISVLTSGLPVDARGTAMASSLLRDGTGPLYNRRSIVDLGAMVRAATRQMNPFAARSTDGDSASAECFSAPAV
jgi:hypothetical protein